MHSLALEVGLKDESGSPKDRPERMAAMKDIDLRTIQPVQERRTPEKPAAGEKASGEAFQKELASAVNRAQDAGNAGSIADRVRKVEQDVNQTSQQINEARNNLQRMLVEMQIRNPRNEK